MDWYCLWCGYPWHRFLWSPFYGAGWQ